MLEATRAAERVDAPEKAPDPLAVVGGAELGPLPAAPRIDGEAEAAVRRHRAVAKVAAPRQFQRRDHRNLRRRERPRKIVLFRNRRIAPATRPVELDHHRIGILEAHLEHSILVAAERKYA